MTLALSRPRHRTDLVRELVTRDIKLRYRRSVLGVAWSQIAPLAMMTVLSFVFAHVVGLKIPHYAAFLFAALLPWIWFQTAIVAGTQSVVGGRDLVRQPGFPVAMLPVVSVTTTLINYLLALPMMFLWIGFSLRGIHGTSIALPVIIAVQFLITVGPCLMLAAINVRFRDVSHIVEIGLLPLFYAMPIIYAQPPHQLHWVFQLNPLAHLMNAYRDALYFGRWPQITTLTVLALIGALLAGIGYRIFDRLSYRFPEEL